MAALVKASAIAIVTPGSRQRTRFRSSLIPAPTPRCLATRTTYRSPSVSSADAIVNAHDGVTDAASTTTASSFSRSDSRHESGTDPRPSQTSLESGAHAEPLMATSVPSTTAKPRTACDATTEGQPRDRLTGSGHRENGTIHGPPAGGLSVRTYRTTDGGARCHHGQSCLWMPFRGSSDATSDIHVRPFEGGSGHREPHVRGARPAGRTRERSIRTVEIALEGARRPRLTATTPAASTSDCPRGFRRGASTPARRPRGAGGTAG